MTKAERIFNATFFEAKKSIRTWGVKYNPNGKVVGFNRLATDNDFICTRTLNAIVKLVENKRKQLQMQKEFLGYKDEIAELALDIVEVTIENEREALEDLKNF